MHIYSTCPVISVVNFSMIPIAFKIKVKIINMPSGEYHHFGNKLITKFGNKLADWLSQCASLFFFFWSSPIDYNPRRRLWNYHKFVALPELQIPS